jgi:hypothetical protein
MAEQIPDSSTSTALVIADFSFSTKMYLRSELPLGYSVVFDAIMAERFYDTASAQSALKAWLAEPASHIYGGAWAVYRVTTQTSFAAL